MRTCRGLKNPLHDVVASITGFQVLFLSGCHLIAVNKSEIVVATKRDCVLSFWDIDVILDDPLAAFRVSLEILFDAFVKMLMADG